MKWFEVFMLGIMGTVAVIVFWMITWMAFFSPLAKSLTELGY